MNIRSLDLKKIIIVIIAIIALISGIIFVFLKIFGVNKNDVPPVAVNQDVNKKTDKTENKVSNNKTGVVEKVNENSMRMKVEGVSVDLAFNSSTTVSLNSKDSGIRKASIAEIKQGDTINVTYGKDANGASVAKIIMIGR